MVISNMPPKPPPIRGGIMKPSRPGEAPGCPEAITAPPNSHSNLRLLLTGYKRISERGEGGRGGGGEL